MPQQPRIRGDDGKQYEPTGEFRNPILGEAHLMDYEGAIVFNPNSKPVAVRRFGPLNSPRIILREVKGWEGASIYGTRITFTPYCSVLNDAFPRGEAVFNLIGSRDAIVTKETAKSLRDAITAWLNE